MEERKRKWELWFNGTLDAGSNNNGKGIFKYREDEEKGWTVPPTRGSA